MGEGSVEVSGLAGHLTHGLLVRMMIDGLHQRESCACHAEMSALLRLKRFFPDIHAQDVGILVYRETASGELALARPCPACEKALRDYGITDIYYTGKNSMVYEKYKI